MNQDMRCCQNREMPVREPKKTVPPKEYAMSFSAWELRLYLDTHPDDERALAAFRQLCSANPEKMCSYACAGTSCRSDSGKECGSSRKSSWCWIDDPWPWEREANETEECR